MKTFAALLVLAASAPAFAQDDSRFREGQARQRASEARQKAAARLDFVDGIRSVGMGGTGTDYRLVIVIRDAQARDAARRELGGDSLDGVRVCWSGFLNADLLPAPAPAPVAASAPFVTPGVPSKVPSYSSAPVAAFASYSAPRQAAPQARAETFYAGPYTQNPRRRHYGWGYNCSPSRHWMLYGAIPQTFSITPGPSTPCYSIPFTCPAPTPAPGGHGSFGTPIAPPPHAAPLPSPPVVHAPVPAPAPPVNRGGGGCTTTWRPVSGSR